MNTPMPRPYMLIIRRGFPTPRWELFGEYDTLETAEMIYDQKVSGRGITAWAWWGSRQNGEKLLSDPHLDPSNLS